MKYLDLHEEVQLSFQPAAATFDIFDISRSQSQKMDDQKTLDLDEEYAKQLQMQFDEEYAKEEEQERLASEFPEGIQEYVVRFLDDLWNNRHLEEIDRVLADDCVSKGSFGSTNGRQEFRDIVVQPLLNAFPDLKYINHETFQEGRRIVNRWTFSGTHTGAQYDGIEPSGKKVSFSGVTITRFNENNFISEMHTFFDRLPMHEQKK